MHPLRRQRLWLVVLTISLSTLAAVVLGVVFRDRINLFYMPAQMASGEVPAGARVRLGGVVVPGSFERLPDGLRLRFAVGDGQHRIPVAYQGILPDLFAVGEAVVLTGTLDPATGVFQATEVLAKHDENYRPPSMQEMELQEAGREEPRSGLPDS